MRRRYEALKPLIRMAAEILAGLEALLKAVEPETTDNICDDAGLKLATLQQSLVGKENDAVQAGHNDDNDVAAMLMDMSQSA